MSSIVFRVAARHLRRLADQPAGARQRAKTLTHPINKPRGIDTSIVTEHAQGANPRKETVDPNRRDVRPEDVFAGTPNQMSVRNLAETGKDLSKSVEKQVSRDKGYGNVRNLSQYLIRSDGGSGEGPVGKR